ncbi:MAG: hypothetical protein SV487_02515 [Thermodesulfobacteriota bacterium]|nr:hypothetical protein [Thermodesulfobacteriota bacterium]
MNQMKNGQVGPLPPDAATVILTRENKAGSFDIFLMRRHRDQTFMGNAFVFPGGRLDKADLEPGLADYAQGLSAGEARLKLNEPDLSAEKALGLFFAAVRETFEESGVLLAAPAVNGQAEFQYVETDGRFDSCRKKLHEREMSLKELAEKENLLYTLDLLTPYAHWITPEIESKRFNTRFLLARMPRRQVPIHDSIEMTESLWITPQEALTRHEAGGILLMPPTLKTVEELSEFSSSARLVAAAEARKPYPILPQVAPKGDGFVIKLPHDPEYTIEGYKQPPRPEEKSRVGMIDGRWRTLRFEG